MMKASDLQTHLRSLNGGWMNVDNTVDFLDANCCIGRPTRPVFQPAVTADDLLAALNRAGVGRALAWHVAQRDVHPAEGNRLMADACLAADPARLAGCWTLLPPITNEGIDARFFERMRENRVAALRAFPDAHRYLLRRAAFGPFLDEVSARRIPLLLSLAGDNRAWPMIYDALQEYPDLTVILCDIGIWGADRYTWPLLDRYPNVHVESSLLALEDGGMEAMAARFGAGRVVFGTGFPERYPESAVLQLLHADLSDADKAAIASGNLARLLSSMSE
jgi:predicted TIM-barrel fold metal-dependent hydrolase